jgi:hypothetical protein
VTSYRAPGSCSGSDSKGASGRVKSYASAMCPACTMRTGKKMTYRNKDNENDTSTAIRLGQQQRPGSKTKVSRRGWIRMARLSLHRVWTIEGGLRLCQRVDRTSRERKRKKKRKTLGRPCTYVGYSKGGCAASEIQLLVTSLVAMDADAVVSRSSARLPASDRHDTQLSCSAVYIMRCRLMHYVSIIAQSAQCSRSACKMTWLTERTAGR